MATKSNRSLINRVLRGNDGKIRATYRVLLAFVAFFTSLLAAQISVAVAGLSPSLPVVTLASALGLLLMSAFFYFIWVQRLDGRPLKKYGIDRSLNDIRQFAVGFSVTLAGIGIWYLLWAATGQMSVNVVLSYDDGALAASVLLAIIFTVAGAAVQGLAFLGLIFNNSTEGVRSRINNERVAFAGGIVTTAVFFLAYHFLTGAGAAGFLPPLQAAVFLLVALCYFTSVYVYTGSLTAAIGAHAAANYSNLLFGWDQIGNTASFPLPEVMMVTGSTPLTDVIGPVPLTGLLISFVLLAASTRTSLVNSKSDGPLASQP